MASLEQWKQNDWLVRDESKLPEVTQLFAVADRELHDASVDGLSVDGKFMHAYDAALTLCQIALRACGDRVNRKQHGHHQKTIESLPLAIASSLQATADLIVVASRKRSQALYDRTGVVDARDADELVDTACALRSEVIKWMTATHAELLPKGISEA